VPTGTLTRVARSAPATLTHTFVVGETPTDAAGAVTVTIVDANGAAVVTAATATHGTTGVYTYAMAGQSLLARYSVAWTGTFSGSAVTETDYVEVVGGFFFNLADARASDSSLVDPTRFPLTALASARQEVEDEAEMICDRAFVPRYRRAVLDGSGTPDVLLTDYVWAQDGRSAADVRAIRSAKVAPLVGQTFVSLTAGELAATTVTADGLLRRVDGGIWTEGVQNVVVEYEYGWDAPPSDLVRAAMVRLRDRLAISTSGIPDRASSFTAVDGGTFRLDMPGAFKTGLPVVDAVYSRYSRRSGAGTGTGRSQAASRTLSYDVQANSLFHQRL
jgi:hypothetical protein